MTKRAEFKQGRAETMTCAQAAKRLRLGRNQVYEAAAAGQLPAVRIGRRVLILTAALDRLLRGETAKPYRRSRIGGRPRKAKAHDEETAATP
jgi:excisionase family DNA binding protein